MASVASPLTFDELDGWGRDRSAAALSAFRQSLSRCAFEEWSATGDETTCGVCGPAGFCDCIAQAVSDLPREVADREARAFFEKWFRPWSVGESGTGLLTGYFEMELAASWEASSQFPVPLHGVPDDLAELIPPAARGAKNGALTHARVTASGQVPYWTRTQIMDGAIDGRCPVLCYLCDPVDAFVLHVQGSGLLSFPDGVQRRVTYVAKNGHPYVSIGRCMIEDGLFAADDLTLDTMVGWLKSNPARARSYMARNPSYIFFKLMGGDGDAASCGAGPVGLRDVALAPGRSLAVDHGFHRFGSLIYVTAPMLNWPREDGASGSAPFARLMVAHDAGSAIKGAQRGDVFAGSGEMAGRLAGSVKHDCSFTVLRPVCCRS